MRLDCGLGVLTMIFMLAGDPAPGGATPPPQQATANHRHLANAQDGLAPYQAESGIVSPAELDLRRLWLEAIQPSDEGNLPGDERIEGWLSSRIPFAFHYGEKDS